MIKNKKKSGWINNDNGFRNDISEFIKKRTSSEFLNKERKFKIAESVVSVDLSTFHLFLSSCQLYLNLPFLQIYIKV